MSRSLKRKQFAVLGLGRFGTSMAITLQTLGCDVIAIDRDEAKVNAVADKVTSAMIGDGSNFELLESIGVSDLNGVIVAIADSMEASVLAAMNAKELGTPYVMAIARNEAHEKLLKKVGADKIIFPEQEIGARIAKNLVCGSFSDWIALSDEYSILEIPVPESWVGKSLMEINVRKKYHVNVVGVKKGEAVSVVLNVERPFEADERLIIIGENEKLEKIK